LFLEASAAPLSYIAKACHHGAARRLCAAGVWGGEASDFNVDSCQNRPMGKNWMGLVIR
jgi:hypothetical protein